MAGLIVIEESRLNVFLRDQQYLDAFSFLRSAASEALQPAKPKCKPCGNKNRAVSAQKYNDLKRAIAGMSSDDKAKLKQMLGAKQVRVIYRGSDNRTIRVTF